MTKIDIYSGFLGAGKTTLIKKLIKEAYSNQKLVIIENEFGEVGIDGGFLQDAGIKIKEMNSGCICCSLVGDLRRSLKQVIADYQPDRVIIEPSGVGKLSDVINAVKAVINDEVTLGYTVAVVDAGKVKIFSKNYGEFYNNQVETASTIVMSRSDAVPQEKLDEAAQILREHNNIATIITTPWSDLSGVQIIDAMEGKASLAEELAQMVQERLNEEDEHHHDHDEHEHHHDHDEHEHHHDHDEHEHHHDHDEHEHHHDHDEHCTCGCHDHEHHHHHHADEVFSSWGVETSKKFTQEEIKQALAKLDTNAYGFVLRAKGILPATDGSWIHFDYVPEEINIRTGSAAVTGKLCVIGSKLDEASISSLFGV